MLSFFFIYFLLRLIQFLPRQLHNLTYNLRIKLSVHLRPCTFQYTLYSSSFRPMGSLFCTMTSVQPLVTSCSRASIESIGNFLQQRQLQFTNKSPRSFPHNLTLSVIHTLKGYIQCLLLIHVKCWLLHYYYCYCNAINVVITSLNQTTLLSRTVKRKIQELF